MNYIRCVPECMAGHKKNSFLVEGVFLLLTLQDFYCHFDICHFDIYHFGTTTSQSSPMCAKPPSRRQPLLQPEQPEHECREAEQVSVPACCTECAPLCGISCCPFRNTRRIIPIRSKKSSRRKMSSVEVFSSAARISTVLD